jgi:hypothetical protein
MEEKMKEELNHAAEVCKIQQANSTVSLPSLNSTK